MTETKLKPQLKKTRLTKPVAKRTNLTKLTKPSITLTTQQLHILKIIYKFRFVTANRVAEYRAVSTRTTNEALSIAYSVALATLGFATISTSPHPAYRRCPQQSRLAAKLRSCAHLRRPGYGSRA